METEVKIAFSSKEELLKITGEEWFADYCMDEENPVINTLDNTYYDTVDRELSRRGAICRSSSPRTSSRTSPSAFRPSSARKAARSAR